MSEPVIVVGGGPAGCASALNLLQAGLNPTIIEADTFPRFHIGESLTTECTDALNRLGLQVELANLGAPRKTGVRIFSSNPDNSFYVGAGDAWQVERARFDKMLLDTAIKRGAILVQGRAVRLVRQGNHWKVTTRLPDGSHCDQCARFVVDASGQKRFSYRQGLFSPLHEGSYARQIAFFSQYRNITRKADDNFDTLIFHRGTHEWCWMIPLTERVTSIGLVTPIERYKKDQISAEEFLARSLAHFSEPLKIRTKGASKAGSVRTVANYSYQIDQYALQGLYCVGDSHRFIDPIFSFGVEFAVVEAEYMSKSVRNCIAAEPSGWWRQEQNYMDITTSAQDTIGDMLSYFWAHPWGFANMAHMRHKEEFLELFAGRVYEMDAGEGLRRMRAAIV